MKRKAIIALICCIGTWIFTQNVQSQQSTSGLGFESSLEYMDQYVFRGRVLDEDPALNSNLTLSVGRLSYSYYMHRDFSSDNDSSFKETNHSVEMTWLLGTAVQTMGYRFYDFGGILPDTQELYYRIAYQSTWRPTLGTFYDIDNYNGYYFDLSLERLLPLTRKSLAGLKFYLAGASGLIEKSNRAGEIKEYGYFADDGLTNGYAKLFYRWYPTSRWTVELGYRYYRSFDDQLKDDPLTGESFNMVSAKIRYIFP
ncbi:MAG: hypothetical protein CR997_12515 [Acidobacteria bacterium]|nr:MAG: hypothetical protein CR997_12515 [Acidobacteriota bacterium]